MQQATLHVTNQKGMHVQACMVFVKMASRFRSRITVGRDGVEVDGKSILGVMSLMAESGAEIQVRADGEDETQALAALREIVEGRFGEE